MLKLRAVSKSYGARALFRDVSLALEPGHVAAITGESGSGKSTLLNIVAGLEPPDTGAVSIEGIDVAALDDDARTLLRRKRMGFVFQAMHLLPHLTVSDNVALPLHLARVPAPDIGHRVRDGLRAVEMERFAACYPRELSGGEQQRAAIARALIHRPALVLADEPTGSLDARNADTVLGLLCRQVKQYGGAGLLVTHSAVAAARADSVHVLTPDGLLQPGS